MPPKQSAKPQRAQKSHSLDRTQDLATAASSGIISRVRRLLQGSNPKWRDASTGKTPLHFAIEHRHFLIAKLLIKRKNIEVDIKDNMDRTPLCYAARVGSLDIFQLLLVKGAILDAPDKFGKTPASYAVESCRQDQGLQILQLLLDRRVKLDVADKKGQSPLFYAAQCGETHVVEFLLKHDSKPDRRDELGRTPLSYAAQDGSLGVVKALLTLNNVDIASRDNTDRTPLIYAVSTKDSMTSFSLHTDTAIALLDRMNVGQIARDNQEGILSEHAARLGRKELAILLKDTMGFYNNSLASLQDRGLQGINNPLDLDTKHVAYCVTCLKLEQHANKEPNPGKEFTSSDLRRKNNEGVMRFYPIACMGIGLLILVGPNRTIEYYRRFEKRIDGHHTKESFRAQVVIDVVGMRHGPIHFDSPPRVWDSTVLCKHFEDIQTRFDIQLEMEEKADRKWQLGR